jgi:hypothetical protein
MPHQNSLGKHLRLRWSRLANRWFLLECDGQSVSTSRELHHMGEVVQFINKPQYKDWPILDFKGEPCKVVDTYNRVREAKKKAVELYHAIHVYHSIQPSTPNPLGAASA